jgi:hypothetical protein
LVAVVVVILTWWEKAVYVCVLYVCVCVCEWYVSFSELASAVAIASDR